LAGNYEIKTQDEIDRINKAKGVSYENYIISGHTHEEAIEKCVKYYTNKNCTYALSKEQLIDVISKDFEDYPEYEFFALSKLEEKYTSPQFLCGWSLDCNFSEFILDNFKTARHYNTMYESNIRTNYYNMLKLDNDSILRSSLEIYFYYLLVHKFNKKLDIDFEVEKTYKGTSYRCDFYLKEKDLYIEICGKGESGDYADHMNFKHRTFGSVLLWKTKEYYSYLESLYGDNV
jgi:hypothetical protein